MRECRFCHQDLEHVPRDASMTRHIVGLCAPSRNEVDSAISQLEIEDEREKEAIRAFWKRERESTPLHVTGWGLLKVFAGVVFFGVLGWLLLIGVFSL